MINFYSIILVACGGAIGATARLVIAKYLFLPNISILPSYINHVTFVNIFGSFLIGIFASFFERNIENAMDFRLFLVTGILGGFTTFSSFSLDFFNLLHRGKVFDAAIYVLFSISLSFIAVFLGYYISK